MNLLEEALSQFGHKEIPGDKHNPEIVKFFTEIGFDIKNDETAWCSAFINWCAMKSGLERTEKLNAKSWLDIGDEVKQPLVGDIAIFHRGDPKGWQGHVGIFVNEINNAIFVLSGNQGNQVSIMPYSKDRLIGYRRLNKV